MSKRIVALCAVTSLVSGCAIHPLPEDVTGVVTEQIVRQIRCETQESLRSIIIGTLANTGDLELNNMAEKYRENRELMRDFSPDLFVKPKYVLLKSVINTFYETAVAYNFDFDMYEDNNISGGVDVLKPLTGGAFSLGVNLSANRKRETERSFTVSDTFSSSLKLPYYYCNGQLATEDYAYPIVGKIGVEPVLRTFIAMTLFGGLSAAAAKDATAANAKAPAASVAATKDKTTPAATAPAEAAHAAAKKVQVVALSGPPTWAEMLAFTTTLSASANPKVTFSPTARALQVSDTNISGTADRTDIHKVTMGLAISPKKLIDIDPLRFQFYGTSSDTLIVGRRVTGGGTPAQQLAVLAIDQLKRDRINFSLSE